MKENKRPHVIKKTESLKTAPKSTKHPSSTSDVDPVVAPQYITLFLTM